MNGEGLADDYIVLTSHETKFSGLGWQLWKCLIKCCLPFLACIFLIGFVGCIKKGSGEWTPPGNDKRSEIRRNIILIRPLPVANAKTVPLDTESRPIRFRIGEFCDSRNSPQKGNLIGHKKGYSDWYIYADVRTSRHPIDIVRAAVSQQLQVMGHQFVDKDADVVVIGEVAEFSVTTSVNSLTWDAIGSIDVILEVQLVKGTDAKIIRRYKAKHVSKKIFGLGPSEVNFEKVMRECLEDIQRQIASDAELARLLDGRTQ